MERVELTAGNGRTLALQHLSDPDDDLIWSYQATLAVPGAGAITTIVHDHSRLLATYFRDLADAWSGFDGTKSFASLEGQLTVDANHDGLGTVRCLIHLRQPWPPEWDLSASFDLGAGAHLDQLANEVEMFTG